MRRSTAAFSLLEAVAIVSLLGVLLAAFLPTFLRKLRTSRLAEAPEVLAILHAGAASYWASASDRHGTGRCLPPPAGPTPPEPTPELRPFQPGPHEAASWKALAPSLPGRPVRFSYRFLPADSGCGLRSRSGEPLLRLRAEGDLDGDGVRSTFERAASVEEGTLVPDGPLLVRQRVE